ncbi:MAG TPA: glycosyltransferase [Chitinophagaceae bacterium]|nr:glycosyltransferase [Chitinophagaceae bacterium]
MPEKKIFIIAPHFPPSSMPPAQRVRLLVRHMRALKWRAFVFTVDHKYREEVSDPWMIELVGNEFEKVDVRCFDQRKTRKFGIGDLGLRMLPFLFFTLIRYARREKPDLILYPVPPWYIMVIAPIVKWFTGRPYAIDFIDPWVQSAEKNKTFKAKVSQWIARRLEGFAVRRSSAVFAVSKGILNDLVERYPSVKNKPLVAVPYGVELDDYKYIHVNGIGSIPGKPVLRYIGAVSDSMLRVVKVFMQSLRKVAEQQPLLVEFIGTSYAGQGMVQPRVQFLVDETGAGELVKEKPERVRYKDALELSKSADVLLLFGDMTPYYAASKLMGLIASQQPFFAFVHEESFPARFLREMNYQYIVEYSTEQKTPEQQQPAVEQCLLQLLRNLRQFTPPDINNPTFREHTAYGMAETFVHTFKKISQ